MEPMKKYIPLIFLVSNAFAYDATVIVLEAPLLKEASLKSTVLQVLRKGQRVYVPHEIGDQRPLPEFIPTFDRAGNPAFVPTKYIKIVTDTVDEADQPIRYAGHDPTDYRIEEPIPVTYPFENRNFVRASVALLVGNNADTPYAYNSTFNEQSYGAALGLRINFTHKIVYDKFDRFYFGFIGMATDSTNNLDFKNANVAKENRLVFRAGPWFTYDAFKNDNYRLNLGTGFTFNYHYSILKVSSATDEEQRGFSGFSLSPMVSTAFTINDVFPNMDFISGVDLSFYLPHSLKNSTETLHPELWGDANQINNSYKTQASLFLGVQFKY
jgi:hypothetical protein